jgi:hypothetical protein
MPNQVTEGGVIWPTNDKAIFPLVKLANRAKRMAVKPIGERTLAEERAVHDAYKAGTL